MNIEGKLIEKFETQNITDSFKKREFVIEYAENPQYPETIKFELIQANCVQLDSYETGDLMTISFNLKGRKWTNPKGETQYFNSLQAWKLEKKGSTASAPAASSLDGPPPPTVEDQWASSGESDNDDLPF